MLTNIWIKFTIAHFNGGKGLYKNFFCWTRLEDDKWWVDAPVESKPKSMKLAFVTSSLSMQY